jgi:mRNA export factor
MHKSGSSVLDTCFSADGSTVFSGGSDKAVRMWSLRGAAPPNNVALQIGVHDTPVKAVGFLRSTNLVVSGGWDRKLKFWDTRTPTPVGVFDMPERVYDLDVRDNLMVVATAGRHIIAYDVSGQPRELTRMISPLENQSRCVACFPDSTGFAVGSIEGRVGIHYLNKVPGKESFAFKCHRQDNDAFAVNSISFHNRYGTVSTVGSDGVVGFWDKDNKQRLKVFKAIERAIPCGSFNSEGSLFAYASSYDWSKGSMHVQQGNEVFIHCVREEDIRPKPRKAGTARKR